MLVKTHYLRLFSNLEQYTDTELGRSFIHYLSVYIVYATKMPSKDVNEVLKKLPPNMENLVKSTYENILEEGIERGIEKGREREKFFRDIKRSIKSLENGLDKEVILNIFETLNKDTLELLAVNVTNEFKVPVFQKSLAAHLFMNFSSLTNEDIATLCKLDIEIVLLVKANLSTKE